MTILPLSFNCCTVADTNFFDLPKPSPIAFISTVPSPTSTLKVLKTPTVADGSTFLRSRTTVSQLSTSASGPPSRTKASTLHSVATRVSVRTNERGSTSTVTQVVTVTPAADGNHPAAGGDTVNRGHVIGAAVGGISFLILASAIAYCVRIKRQRKKRNECYRREDVAEMCGAGPPSGALQSKEISSRSELDAPRDSSNGPPLSTLSRHYPIPEAEQLAAPRGQTAELQGSMPARGELV
ncbi:uncharacterized protein LTR77_010982 [Saxophila tyrrhenica]|uniref:Uncharacterized protein n=1 Tax=Saxophila tyrrhenica TaxID=1690608 RepID=A0AAV9NVK5_9PEZI|nr:hypothetical protein LTR77_010982 [Saxophila tyrrhenica]